MTENKLNVTPANNFIRYRNSQQEKKMNFDIVKSNGNRFFLVSLLCFLFLFCIWFYFLFNFDSCVLFCCYFYFFLFVFLLSPHWIHAMAVGVYTVPMGGIERWWLRRRRRTATITTVLLMEKGSALSLQSSSALTVWWTFLLENFESFSPLAKTISSTQTWNGK